MFEDGRTIERETVDFYIPTVSNIESNVWELVVKILLSVQWQKGLTDILRYEYNWQYHESVNDGS